MQRRSCREQQSKLTNVLPSNECKGHTVHQIEDGVPQAEDSRHPSLLESKRKLLETLRPSGCFVRTSRLRS